MTVSNSKLEIYTAHASNDDGPFVAGEEDIDPALPMSQVEPALVSALKGVTTTSNLTINGSPSATSFQSHSAEKVTYSQANKIFSGLSFVTNGGGRLYILLAPDQDFDAFKNSFTVKN